MNEQTNFWQGTFGDKYRSNNQHFNEELLLGGWVKMLQKIDTSKLSSVLECGCNIGRNLWALKRLLQKADLSLIELNKESYQIAIQSFTPKQSYNGAIIDSNFSPASFDLVFTCGVLIHIAPYNLYQNLQKIYSYSRKYILISEYFSRKLEMVLYHGETNKLFKMDFGGFFMDNFKVKIIDYGFLWGREFDAGGFDDMTFWLFEKE